MMITTDAFDRKCFAELLALAKGEKRSMNQYAKSCGVTVSYISRLLRAMNDYPPSPQIIRKFAEYAINGVTYEQFMQAAGHLQDGDTDQPSLELDKGIQEMMIAKEELTQEEYEELVKFTARMRKMIISDRK